MKFLVVTNAPTLYQNKTYCAYAPYVREMDIWSDYVDEFKILSPNSYSGKLLIAPFKNQPELVAVPSLQLTSIKHIILSVIKLPIIIIALFKAMIWADHIHLRCPGNIGLLGCVVQIFFPKKIKTAKYAGNWDPNAKQPLSYRIQKWMLSNTFLTKNISVLVYGNWPNQSKNIKPFFTATFNDAEKEQVKTRDYSKPLQFMFVGSLVEGKRPMFAIQFVQQLVKSGTKATLDVFGDGILKAQLQDYIHKHNLDHVVKLHGNQSKDTVKAYYKTSHFLILASKSEGWPKVLAEAMFFGAIPIATNVSCVADMLGEGQRGLLITPDINNALKTFKSYTEDQFKSLSINALHWSQTYTLDRFENEVKDLILFKENREISNK